MTQKRQKNEKRQNIWIVAAIVLVLAGGYLFQNTGKADIPAQEVAIEATTGEGIKIMKSDITTTAKFYPYKVGNTEMEVLAVKATDGTIRTALNTCQVCFDSGAGYYKQEGDVLVCQNCGNRFGVDDVEVVKGGCNPVPVGPADKKEAGEFVEISHAYLASQIDFFQEWKTR